MERPPLSEMPPGLESIEARHQHFESIFGAAASVVRAASGQNQPIPGFGLPEALVPRLFRRAPDAVMAQRSKEDLARITLEAFNCLQHWLLKQTPASSASVTLLPAETATSGDQKTRTGARVIVALFDRPFIINTINAALREHELSASLFLHPILSVGSESVSLSYLELRPAPDGAVKRFTEWLSASLPRLAAVTDDFPAMLQAVDASKSSLPALHSTEEEQAFLAWLADEGFVLQAVGRWTIDSTTRLNENAERPLGLFRGSDRFAQSLLQEAREDAQRLLSAAPDALNSLLVCRSRFMSPIHHHSRLTSVQILLRDAESRPLAVTSVLGQFTSKALSEESSRIPIVRARLRRVLQAEGLRPSSHLYKTAINIVDSMPTHAALSANEATLQQHIRAVLDSMQHLSRKAQVRLEPNGRGAWVMILLPSEEFRADIRRTIQHELDRVFRAPSRSTDWHITSLDAPECCLYFYVPVDPTIGKLVDIRALEGELVNLTKGWPQALIDALQSAVKARPQNARPALEPKMLEHKYAAAFGEEYQAIYAPAQAAEDVLVIEGLSSERPVAVRLSPDNSAGSDRYLLSVYQLDKEITLSKSLPILEHAGFEVLHERSNAVKPAQGPVVYLHRFPVRTAQGLSAGLAQDARHLEVVTSGLENVFLGKAEDDALNALMIGAGLDGRALSMLRAYCMLLWQMKKFATRQTIREALVNHPQTARQLWEIASLKFDPGSKKSVAERKEAVERELFKFREQLRAITDITADRILRSLAMLVQHTVRTNFFRSDFFEKCPAVALKIHSEGLELLSTPRPLFEIFVCAPQFEAVHLRGSRVARGGIRWSDRREDFRTEVRDLMRTQQVKNAIIVPSGAKGGFVVKELPSERAAQAEAVKRCYQDFIRALLSVTDNRVKGTVTPPPQVVCFDDPDPYLVVAADKGTASFSDVANAIATNEFDFWLGDAFASGGSNGYDHKKLGITARGAWEAVLQHFKEARIDYENTPFTVTGIGDMSGDVFGNGLLLSKQMRLLGAFNHKHIFIDPNPDPARSWEERKRLFDTPFSQWSDYKRELLSPGGAIYDRLAKEITLSPQARQALGVPAETPASLSGEQVVSLILRAPVDLLWNGGIGTYVKSRTESDADVGDSTNDAVRINADELRSRVVAEGGNLGLTQRARIDFAQRGGLINTDAIDNSGGVDTSDHEVNLKILFQSVLQSGALSRTDRDAILKELAPAVVEDVLSHNRGQAVLLLSSAKRGNKNLEYFRSLISELAKRGYVHRVVHTLPTDDDLEERMRSGSGLVRPELAICTAGVKLWMKDELLQSGLTKDALLRESLFDYFPPRLHKDFSNAISSHPLADNIVATEIANELVETVGLTFVHRMCISQSVEPAAALSALLAAHRILGITKLREHINAFDTFENHSTFLELRIEVSAALREATAWLIANHARKSSLADMVQRYQSRVAEIMAKPEGALSGRLKTYYQERLLAALSKGLKPAQAPWFAAFPLIPLLLETLWAADTYKVSAPETCAAFSTVVDAVNLFAIFAMQRKVAATNKWEHELRLNAYDEIRRAVSLLTGRALEQKARSSAEVDSAIRSLPGIERLRSAASELSDRTPEVAMLGVFARQLRLFAS